MRSIYKLLNTIVRFIFLLFLWSCIGCSGTESSNEQSLPVNGYYQFENKSDVNKSWPVNNQLVIQIKSDPATLHPTNGNSVIRTFILQYTQRMLVTYDAATLSLKPELIKELPQPITNSCMYTYELRDDVFWDDGTPVTIADVVFTFKANKCRLVQNFHSKTYFEALIDVIIPDSSNNKKFIFKMKQQSARNPGFSTGIPIMQQKIVDPENILARFSIPDLASGKVDNNALLQKWASGFNSVDFGRKPNLLSGLGPYNIVSWESNQELVLIKKSKNNFRQAHLDKFNVAFPSKIIFTVIKDPQTFLLRLKSQQVDASINVSEAIIEQLLKDRDFNANYHLVPVYVFSYSYLAMNMRPEETNRKPIFVDKRVRKAMALLTPYDVIKKVCKKHGGQMLGPLFLSNPEFNSKLPTQQYNFPKAIQLLKEAGWKDVDQNGILEKEGIGDLTFELGYPVAKSFSANDMVLLLAEYYARAGIKVKLVPFDSRLLHQKAINHDFDMILSTWNDDFMPPDYAELWHTKSWFAKGSNYTGFGNPVSDSLITLINSMPDKASRLKYSHQFQKMIMDEQPYVFLFREHYSMLAHKRFNNVEFYAHKPYMLLNNWKPIIMQP